MSKTTRVALLLALLACSVAAAPQTGRSILQKKASLSQSSSASSSDPKGSASASGSISVTEGEGTLEVIADSQTFQESRSQIKQKVQELVEIIPNQQQGSKKEFCTTTIASIDDELTSIGSVAVEAFVDTLAFVQIDGVGSGCAGSAAKAEATAAATVQAVIDAWVEVAANGNSAAADISAQAITTVLAKASAEASAEACIESEGDLSFAEAGQTVLASAYAKAVASILFWLEAGVDCSGTSDSFSEAEVTAAIEDESTTVDGETTSIVEGQGTADATGSGEASVDRVTQRCPSPVSFCCAPSNKRRGEGGQQCRCNSTGTSRRSKCTADFFKDDEGRVIWDAIIDADGSNVKCRC